MQFMKKIVLSAFIFLLSGISSNILLAQIQDGSAVWKYKTDGKIIGSAEIAQDIIFFGSDDGTLHAVHTSDGRIAWTKKLGGRIASKPAYQEGHLFVLSGDGTLHKINSSDGTKIWAFKTEGTEKRFKRYTSSGEEFDDIWDYYLSSPAIHEGTIFFGSSDYHIYAVDVKSGQLKWKFKTGNVVHSDPVVDEETVYTGSFDGYMYALDIENGSLRWKFDTIGATYFPEGAVQQGAALYEGVLLFGSRDYNLYVLDKQTGKGNWNFKAESWIIGRPLVHEERVYFGTSDSHLLYSKDINDYRKLYWKADFPLRNLGSPVAHEDVIYAGNFDGALYGLNKETGEIEWRFRTDGHKKNYSTIFQDDGTFQADFSIYGETIEETAANDETMMSLGSILATPVIQNEIIFFGGTDSTFYAVQIPELEN